MKEECWRLLCEAGPATARGKKRMAVVIWCVLRTAYIWQLGIFDLSTIRSKTTQEENKRERMCLQKRRSEKHPLPRRYSKVDNSGANSLSFDSGGVFDVHFYIYTSYQRLGDELVNSDQRHEPILARKALHVRYAALRVRMSLLSVRTTITVFVLAWICQGSGIAHSRVARRVSKKFSSIQMPYK